MGKRGNGEGSITRRKNGTWTAQYVVYTADGRKRETLYGKTRQEVAAKLAKALSDREGGLAFDASSFTLGIYLDRWLSDSVQGSVRATTYRRYEELTRLHIKPTLGRLKLKTLTPSHVRALYREKLDAGLAPRTVNYIHRTLYKALKQAAADGLVPRNVASVVKPPKPAAKKEIRPLDRAQVKALLEAARDDTLEALYIIAVMIGLREGELLGLKWEDVDLEAGTLSVHRSLSYTTEEPIFNSPKNGKGRSLKLTGAAVGALRRHKTAQNEERLRLGTLWEDHGLIFPGQTGRPMRAWSLIGGPFKRLLKHAGLPDIRFHDLRHTCATLLLSQGVHPKFVQELLGHATISITLDTYSHVLPGMGDQTAVAMENALV